ncbi:MAG: hypothetical protein IT312_09170 [Anaerolineales bacterium]|nr:hypothetical protein [Anaerolineales bacterium]
MNCFYHPNTSAIGLCKHCQRGLCSECIALVDDMLACKNRHEEQVKAMGLQLVQARRVRSDYIRNTIFYGMVGILFTAFGVSQLKWLGLQAGVYAVIGLALLWAAVSNYLESRKYR